MDYPEIIADVTDRTGHLDTASRAPRFTRFAEADLNKRLRTADMETAVSLVATTSVPLPDDFLEVRSIKRGTVPLTQVRLAVYQDFGGYDYAIRGRTLLCAAGTVDMVYYAALPSIVEAQTNWLTDLDPELYVYAIMRQVFVFKGEIEKAQAAEAMVRYLVDSRTSADRAARFLNVAWSTEGVTP